MESEVYKEGVSMCRRNGKEVTISYRSRISKSYEDPMPEYISPELLMLIAQNAPSELDVFKKSRRNWNKLSPSARSGNLDQKEQKGEIKTRLEADCQKEYGVQAALSSRNEQIHNPKQSNCARSGNLDQKLQKGENKTRLEADCQKEYGVQVALSSRNEQIHNLKQSTMDARHSCPEMMIWSDCDTKGSHAHKMKNVKRKRPKSLDPCKFVFRDVRSSISANSSKDKQEDDHIRTMVDDVVSFPKSVDFSSFDVEQKSGEFRPASTSAVSASRYESTVLNEKPWRHGMKKRTQLKPTESIYCKKKAEVDPKKLIEVKKYMETKFAQLRNERHMQKARAEAALAARKEKQRKLDVECQALLKSQAVDVKTKQKPFSRPPWTSEYVTFAESFRPWSRASTGDLPPPKVPHNQTPVPMDMYDSISTHETGQKSFLREGCNKLSFSKLRTKRRYKKMKMSEGGENLQRKKMTSDMYEIAFPPTHQYHALHHHQHTGTRKKIPLATKARWKAKGKSLKRCNHEKIYQLQLPLKHASQNYVDLIANRRTGKTSRAPHTTGLHSETNADRTQKRCENSSHNGIINVLPRDDCYAISALKKHERDIYARSKGSRPTSAPTAEQIFPSQYDSKPKYSRVRSDKRGNVAVHSKELSLQGIAEVMKSRLPPDSNTERRSDYKTKESISAGVVDSPMYRRHASLRPRKQLRLDAIPQDLKSTKTELLNPRNSLWNEAESQVFDSTREVSLSPNELLRDEGTMQVLRAQRKDTTSVDIEISKDVTRAIRRQRMHMLRSLTEQLVKRVDAACVEQQLQNTPTTFEPHVDIENEPFNQSAGLYCSDEPLLVEPKRYNHCTQPDILYHGHLSELEQAGCQTVELLEEETMSKVICNVNDLSKDRFAADTGELVLKVIPGSEISSHDFNVIDKGMSMSDNIPSGCSSYGPSSPSTDSGSPVILPTGAKYNIRRIKRNKNTEEQARKRQKEAWGLPAEEDIHSVINLYTQHWLSREMKKKQSRYELTQIGEGDSEENTYSRSKSFTPLHEHAPEKHKFKFGAAPICSELEISEPCVRSLESNCFTSMKCADSYGVYKEPVTYIMEESTIDDMNVEDTPAPVEKSLATIDVEPMEEDNGQTNKSTGDPGQRKSEGMLVQIGDLRLRQSPTSFHLRLDTHKDDHQLKKPLGDLGAIAASKMESAAAGAYTPLVGSSEDSQTQTFKSPMTPMKITYARRLKTRTTPDGVSTGDERIVVEFHRINREGGELVRQNCSTELEPPESSTSETLQENLRVNRVEVENCDDPNCNPKLEKDINDANDESGTQDRCSILQPETCMTSSDIKMVVSRGNGVSEKEHLQKIVSEGTPSRSRNNEADSFTSLNSPIKRFDEKLDPLSTDEHYSVGGNAYSKLLNNTDNCERKLDRLPTKPSDFVGESICSKINTKLVSDGESSWEKGEDEKKRQNNSTNSTLDAFGPKDRSHHEQQLELLSESKHDDQSNLRHNTENTLEWQLKLRRDQLEAELQKLDAEIRTRAKLQANHTGFHTKTICEQSDTSVIAEKPSTAFSEDNSSSKTGVVLSEDFISGRPSHARPSNRALLGSPKQETRPSSSSSATIRTLDRKVRRSIHSDSFVSEDIQMEEEIFSARTIEMIPDTVGGRYGTQYELPCRRFMNENFTESKAKSSSIYQHDQPAKEISEEELLNSRTMSTRDEVVDEGSENSTGRVPFRRFGRASLCERREATIPSASSERKGSPFRHSEDQMDNLAYHELQPLTTEERSDGILYHVAVEINPISEADEGCTHSAKEMKGGKLSSAPWDGVAGTDSADTDSREEMLNACSYFTSTPNKRELNHTASGDRESGSRSLIQPRQAKRSVTIDMVHVAVDETSTMDLQEDGRDAQSYGAGIYSTLEFGSSFQRRTIMTSVTNTEVPSQKISTSSLVRKQWQVDAVEDLPWSSIDEGKSSIMTPKAPEVVDVAEDSPSSSRDGTYGKSKTSEMRINTRSRGNLEREITEISEGVKVLPLNSTDGRLQKSESSACVSDTNPLLHHTSKQASEVSAQEEEESCSSGKRGNITNVFSAVDTSNVFHYPPTPHEKADGALSELKEPLDLGRNSQVLTVIRDGQNDPVKGTSSLNSEEENYAIVSFQDEGFSTRESGRMSRLWTLDADVYQNLTEDSNEESIKQLLQRKKTSFTKSKEDNGKLVTNLLNPHVEAETLNVVIPWVRPGRLRQHLKDQITSEVGGSECLEETPRSSIFVAEGTITEWAVEVISRSSNARTESGRNSPQLPRSVAPLSQSYSSNSAARSQWSPYDHGPHVTTDPSTDSLTDVDNKVVTSFHNQTKCPSMPNELHQSSCADILGVHCDLEISREGRNERWERLVRLCQDNDKRCTLRVSTFSPRKTHAPTVYEKSSEVGEGQRILLESSRTGENSSTIVPEVIENFIVARGDVFRDCSQRKQDYERFRPLKPSPLMSKNKVGYQELAKIDKDVRESRQKPLPPVLLSESSKPLEISARFTNCGGEEEHLKAKDSTSGDHQETHAPYRFGTLRHEEQSPLAGFIQNKLRAESSKDCIPQKHGEECSDELITSTRIGEKTEMPSSGQGSTPVPTICDSGSLPRPPLNLFSSLYGNGDPGPVFISEGSDVSEEYENFVSDEAEKGENSLDVGLTSEHVGREKILEPRSPQQFDPWNISENSCDLDNESLGMAIDPSLITINHDVLVENQGEHGLTKSSCEVETTAKSSSISFCEKTKVENSSTLRPACKMNFNAHSRNFLTICTPLENDDQETVNKNHPTAPAIDHFEDSEDIRADIKCDTSADLVSVEDPEKEASAMLIALSQTMMKNIDTTTTTLRSGIKDDCEENPSSGGCGQDGDIARDNPYRMDLGLDKETAAGLGDLAYQECSDQNSTRVPSGALIHILTCSSSGRSSPITIVDSDENHETKLLSSLPLKISEDKESLMSEVLSSKSSSCSSSLGGEDCLNVPKDHGQNRDLASESSWSEDEGKSDESENISPRSADDKFHEKEALKDTLRRVEAKEEKHVSTAPAIHVKFTSQMCEPPISCLPEEAHRLVECFLSSGSQLLDRATQVSKAFAGCSIENNNPGKLQALECCDQRIVPKVDNSSVFRGLPSQWLSISSAIEKAEDGERHEVFTCGPDEARVRELLHPSRPDQIIALRSLDPAYPQSGYSTLKSKPAVLDTGINENYYEQDVNSAFTTLSPHDKITAQQFSASGLFPPKDLFSHNKNSLAPLESTTKDDMQHELRKNQSVFLKDKTSTSTELSEFRDFMDSVTSSIPQLASALAISLQIPDAGEPSSSSDGDKLFLSEENSTLELKFGHHSVEDPQSNVVEHEGRTVVHGDSCLSGGERSQLIYLEATQRVEIQDNEEQSLCKVPTEDTSTVTDHDQDSVCSLDGSGESQDLDGTLEYIKVQTIADKIGKHNMMADTLTDMLFETLLAEGLSDLVSPSRSMSRASSTEGNRTTSVSRTLKPRTKGRSNKGFVGLLQHFLPVGWRAASTKHKTGLFLQVEGLKPHPLTLGSRNSLSISGIEGLTAPLQSKYTSLDDFEQRSLVHRATTETAIPLLISKEHVQCYVQKILERTCLDTDPSPSNWYDCTIPIGQDIYREVMETGDRTSFGALKQGDWQVQNKLLIDLINESLIKYCATMHQSPLTLPFSVDGGNVVQFVTSRIVEHGTSASKHGSDIDNVVGRLLEDEQWERCYEEERDLISDLAQGILCDLIERFVQEMIQGMNCSRFSVSVYRNSCSY